MTSRDLTENVEQLQVFRALQVIRQKRRPRWPAGQAGREFRDMPLTARTHNVAAQVTTWASASRCSARKCCWAAGSGGTHRRAIPAAV
jgi:adenylosuccinate lyase